MDGDDPILFVSNKATALGLELDLELVLFKRHEKVGFNLKGVCSKSVPKAVKGFDTSEFEGIDIDENIGINVSDLRVNLTKLAIILKNDTEVDLPRFHKTPTRSCLVTNRDHKHNIRKPG